MLLTTRMTSIPSSPRHSILNIKDLQKPHISFPSPPVAPSSQYSNMRVTDRLHRYRSLKREWNEVAATIHIDSSLTLKSDSPIPNPDILPPTHEQIIQEYIAATIIKEKTSLELDPLHSQIQKDLIKLRKMIKSKRKKHSTNVSSKTNTNNRPSGDAIVSDDQEQNNVKKLSSVNKSNTLDRVKISGCQMRPSTFPQTNSATNRIINIANSSTTTPQCSKQQQQKIRQQNINRIFNIYHNRVNSTLPLDSHIQGVPLSKKKITTPPKTRTPIPSLKQAQSYRLPIPPIVKKKPTSNVIKQEIHLPPIREPSTIEQTTTCLYNYAASTSSATPNSMKLTRTTSILPILLTSSSCIGIQPKKNDSEKTTYNLLDYKHFISHLPKPIISIIPRYDQGEYGILFNQLNHIRETMPDSNVYENFTRIC